MESISRLRIGPWRAMPEYLGDVPICRPERSDKRQAHQATGASLLSRLWQRATATGVVALLYGQAQVVLALSALVA